MPRPAMLIALVLLIAACTDEKKAGGAGTAAGEVLPGSASDAMLPLDTVRSQAPLAPKAEGDDPKAKGKSSEAAAPAAAAEEPSPEPAEPAEAADEG
jgi:hypothetical protein